MRLKFHKINYFIAVIITVLPLIMMLIGWPEFDFKMGWTAYITNLLPFEGIIIWAGIHVTITLFAKRENK